MPSGRGLRSDSLVVQRLKAAGAIILGKTEGYATAATLHELTLVPCVRVWSSAGEPEANASAKEGAADDDGRHRRPNRDLPGAVSVTPGAVTQRMNLTRVAPPHGRAIAGDHPCGFDREQNANADPGTAAQV